MRPGCTTPDECSRSDPSDSQEPRLDSLRQRGVAHDREPEQRPVQRRQPREPEVLPHGREWEGDADGHDHRRHDHQGPRGAALEERDLVRADDVDDQRLREQALDEPARLKQAGTPPRRLRRAGVPAVEHVQHHEIRRVVEQRRAWADEDDEPGELAQIPGPGPCDLLRIDVVGRDGRLADVGEQIVGEDLNRHHGQVGNEDARPQDAEHVPDVAACGHADVFEDVGEDPAPLDDSGLEDEERLLEEDHVGRGFRDIDRRVDADPDVGCPESHGIVDAVAHEPHGVILCLQRPNDSLFVRRQDADARGPRGPAGFSGLPERPRANCPW